MPLLSLINTSHQNVNALIKLTYPVLRNFVLIFERQRRLGLANVMSSSSHLRFGSTPDNVESIPSSSGHSSSFTSQSSSSSSSSTANSKQPNESLSNSYDSNPSTSSASFSSQSSGSSSASSANSDNSFVVGGGPQVSSGNSVTSTVVDESSENSSGAFVDSSFHNETETNSTMEGPKVNEYSEQNEPHGYHDPTLKTANVYSCGYNGDPRHDTFAIEIEYQYKIIISRQANDNEALLNVEKIIMQDLSDSFGCSETKRNLRKVLDNKIVGFQWSESIYNNSQVLCGGSSNDPLLTCDPVKAQFTAFLEGGISHEAAEEAKNLLISKIQDGMAKSRYTSEDVKQVIFSNDQSQISTSSPHTLLESPKSTAEPSSRSKFIPIGATFICIFVALLVILLVQRQSKRNSNIAPARSNKKSKVTFAPNLEEEIVTSNNNSLDNSDGNASCSRSVEGSEHGRDMSSFNDSDLADSDMILQWVDSK